MTFFARRLASAEGVSYLEGPGGHPELFLRTVPTNSKVFLPRFVIMQER